MTLLKKASNRMAFAKVGLYGDAGSGKTATASKLAIGLHSYAGLKKPVAFFDTEPAASFVKPLFDAAGIELLVAESRALADLMEFMDEAESSCSIAIIDSITHVWKDAQDSYIKKMNEIRQKQKRKAINQIEFQDWRHIKGEWAKFTDRFLCSKLHCFVCGRAGTIYEYQKNDRTNKMELISTGTKMSTEKEMGYEPSLLIEMKKIVGETTGLINRAFVEKDRNISNPLTGKWVDYPDFIHFEPHWDFLNIGGEHFSSMDRRDSKDLYTDTGEDTFSYEKRQREIFCEEIKSIFIENGLDGTGKEAKEKRNKTLKTIFGTGSWTKVENTDSRTLKQKLEQLKQYLGDSDEPEQKPTESERDTEQAAG